jgi:GH24 family phage-related lysozyme (muramidase)
MKTIEDVLIAHEGLIQFPYLCTEGRVTIGVGCTVTRTQLTADLDWVAPGCSPVHARLLALSGYDAVLHLELGRTPGYYAPHTRARATKESCLRLLKRRVTEIEKLIQRYGWDTTKMPEPCRLVCLDIAFQIGAFGLSKYRHLKICLDAQDYVAASREVSVRGKFEARNKWRKETMCLSQP